MDRRSWLWRRKSSEKSPSGETESSGSVSSHSERFSDDQTLSALNTQSPEVTSKAAPPGDELNDSVKALSEKLSEALLNIRAKEDLVKQHAKVAEEAVSGWERAENEVSVLKKQNDALAQKNSILEESVGHLDGALKECLRQLRQAREEQEEKIYDAVAKKDCEWESEKSELENKLVELRAQLQITTDADKTMLAEIRSKLDAVEKENSILKLKLLSKAEELELRTSERDLSTQAAETASKQHLDSIKRVAKLEAECRRLKALARKGTLANDQRSGTASSFYVESFTDSQSDSGERALVIENDGCKSVDSEPRQPDSWASPLATEIGHFKHEKTLGRSLIVPSVEIDLMDDFLEMEKIAALPETNSGSDPTARDDDREASLRDELEVMISRTTELEEKLKTMTAEKVNLEFALSECQIQLKASGDQLKATEVKLVELNKQLALANGARRDAEKEVENTKLKLKNATNLLDEAEVNLLQIQDQLIEANEAKSIVEAALEEANLKKAEAESEIKVMELELETLHSSINTLKKEVEKERNISREAVAKCDILEAEVSRMKSDSQFQRSTIIEEFRINQDKELAVAASKFAECQKTIASLDRQLKSLATLEDFLIDSDRPVAVL
ncbi:UNVERIFIED_CONTAM: Filament-like plant protein 3 [Sesamum latifolium]|uniref:Filament-like plant protein 3 n=1 Tax=Sesamum latifolium TaxID=2727402 RepID=A0AAW2Y947_9LAMI